MKWQQKHHLILSTQRLADSDISVDIGRAKGSSISFRSPTKTKTKEIAFENSVNSIRAINVLALGHFCISLPIKILMKIENGVLFALFDCYFRFEMLWRRQQIICNNLHNYCRLSAQGRDVDCQGVKGSKTFQCSSEQIRNVSIATFHFRIEVGMRELSSVYGCRNFVLTKE